jgi:hypothetical protein
VEDGLDVVVLIEVIIRMLRWIYPWVGIPIIQENSS